MTPAPTAYLLASLSVTELVIYYVLQELEGKKKNTNGCSKMLEMSPSLGNIVSKNLPTYIITIVS